MANHRKPKRPCSIPGCDGFSVCRGFCQRHYDGWYAKIRLERRRQRNRERPFVGIPNPYRVGTGYYWLLETIRQNLPLTTDQLFRRAKAELAKSGRIGYRLDFAFEVVKAKRHSSKKGDYQLRQDAKGRWHLVSGRGIKRMEDDDQRSP